MTPQEIFNKVATHLFTQGEKAVEMLRTSPERDPEPYCRYRMKKGGKTLTCAAGCLIPDEVYKPDMENWRIHMLTGYKGFPDYLKDNLGMLRRLQGLHDTGDNCIWETSASMRARLAGLAFEYHLNTDVLDTLSFADGR